MNIVLFEIDIPLTPPAYLNRSAGTYIYTLSYPETTVTDDHSVEGYYPSVNEGAKYNIKSVRVNNGTTVEYYTQATTEAGLTSDKMFYFSFDEQYIIVRYEDDNPPYVFESITFGNVCGFCNKYDVNSLTGAYFNDIIYHPRLKSVGSITRKIDPLFFGIIALLSNTISLINSDGFFDNWKDENVFGQTCRLLYGDPNEGYDYFETLFEGVVEEPEWDWNEYKIKAIDKRAMLSRKIPVNTITAANYPYAPDEAIGRPVPLIYGTHYGVKLLPIGDAGGTWNYIAADTSFHALSSIANVCTRGDDDAKTARTFSASTTTGIVAVAKLTDEDDQPEASADIVGFIEDGAVIDNALDVIIDILTNYGDTPYTSTFYDLTEWASEQAKALDVALLLSEQKEIKQVIESICVANSSIFYPTRDGKYTAKSYDAAKTPVYTIPVHVWLSEPTFKKPAKEYLTSVDIKYGQRKVTYAGESEWTTLHYAPYEAETFNTYKVYAAKTYETCLATLAHATTKAAAVITQSRTVEKTVSRVLPSEYRDIDVEDIIIASHHRYGATEEWALYRVLSVTFEPETEKVKVEMKYIEDYTGTETEYALMWDGTDYLVDDSGNYLYGEV